MKKANHFYNLCCVRFYIFLTLIITAVRFYHFSIYYYFGFILNNGN